MSARFVHYKAVNGEGFACLKREAKEHIDSPRVAGGRRSVPLPKVTSDVRGVTCEECWREILTICPINTSDYDTSRDP